MEDGTNSQLISGSLCHSPPWHWHSELANPGGRWQVWRLYTDPVAWAPPSPSLIKLSMLPKVQLASKQRQMLNCFNIPHRNQLTTWWQVDDTGPFYSGRGSCSSGLELTHILTISLQSALIFGGLQVFDLLNRILHNNPSDQGG